MSNNGVAAAAPTGATDAVLKPSDPVPDTAVPVAGLDFDDFRGRNATAAEIVAAMSRMGFQASSLAQAVEIVDGMVGVKLVAASERDGWSELMIISATLARPGNG